jgi:hypothetical protein
MSPDRVLSPAEEVLLAELDRRAEPTRAQAKEGLWVYESVEDLVIQVGRWYLPTLAPTTAAGFSGAATKAWELRARYVEGFLLDLDDRVQPAAWAVKGEVIVAGTGGGLAFRGVPLTRAFADAVRRRSGAASVPHGQKLDRWRVVEFGLLGQRFSGSCSQGG